MCCGDDSLEVVEDSDEDDDDVDDAVGPVAGDGGTRRSGVDYVHFGDLEDG